MNKPIDWEQSMLATEASARKSARLSERLIGGLAEVLASQRRLSQEFSEMTRTIAEVKAQLIALPSLHPGQRPPQQIASLPSAEPTPLRHSWRWLALAFAIGSVFGAFIGNW